MNNGLGSRNPIVMLVEGLADRHFVWHIRNELAPSLSFAIDIKGRRSTLIDSIYGEVSPNSRRIVGIMVDADLDPKTRWDEITSRLDMAGVEVPANPDPSGTVIAENPPWPRVGIWLMPDNRSPGELEDFVIDMIPESDLVWPRSVDYVDGIPISEREFSERKTDRAKLYAWLATRRQPPHIGAAIGAGDFDLSGERCDAFVAWLRRLYD